MKRLTLLIALMPFMAFAQAAFTVKGTGDAFKNGYKMYLIYKEDGKTKFDSAIVNNHAFEFKGTINSITKATLYKNENPMLIEYSHDAGTVYLEAGNIVISAKDSLSRAPVLGTPTNADYTTLRDALLPIEQKYKKQVDNFEALTPAQKADINNVAAIRAVNKQLNKEMEPVKFAFIKAHPNSYISLVTLNELARNVNISDEVNDAYLNLALAIRQTTLGQSLAQQLAGLQKASTGIMATDFTQPDTKGKPVKLSDFKGKYVLVDFWASWCGPCRAENPFILSAYQKYKDKGFTVLGVSIDDESGKKAWLKAISDDKLP